MKNRSNFIFLAIMLVLPICIYFNNYGKKVLVNSDKYNISFNLIEVSRGIKITSNCFYSWFGFEYPSLFALGGETIEIEMQDDHDNPIVWDSIVIHSDNIPRENDYFYDYISFDKEELSGGKKWKFTIPIDSSLIGKNFNINIKQYFSTTEKSGGHSEGRKRIAHYSRYRNFSAIDKISFTIVNKDVVLKKIKQKDSVIRKALLINFLLIYSLCALLCAFTVIKQFGDIDPIDESLAFIYLPSFLAASIILVCLHIRLASPEFVILENMEDFLVRLFITCMTCFIPFFLFYVFSISILNKTMK